MLSAFAAESSKQSHTGASSSCIVRILASVWLASLATADLATAQALDPSFGNDGVVLTNIGPGDTAEASAVGVQPDGKLVAAGQSYNGYGSEIVVVRYQRDGGLDATFGGDGMVTTRVGPYSSYAGALVVQGDGKLVVAGGSFDGTFSDFMVLRLNQDGSLDSTFGSGGVVVTPMNGWAFGAALDSEGRIVAVGRSGGDLALARYESDGRLDARFGAGGIVRTAVSDSDDTAAAVEFDDAGRIVVAGHSCCDEDDIFIVARYQPDGRLDRTFDRDGIVTTEIGPGSESAFDLAIQADGKIIAAGRSYTGADSDFALVRYHIDGRVDTSFGDDGKVTTPVGGADRDGAHAVAIQSDGKIVAAGYAHALNQGRVAVARYEPTGDLDSTFNGNGIVTIDPGADDDGLAAVAVQRNGKIVAAGVSSDGGINSLLATRLLANGTPDATFGVEGIVMTQGGASTDEARAVAIQPDGRLLVGGVAQIGSQNLSAIARYAGDGNLDATFGRDGIVVTYDRALQGITYDLTVLHENRIAAVGMYGGELALIGLDPHGNVDESFGENGRTVLLAPFSPWSVDIETDHDGRIIAVGSGRGAVETELFVARFDADGRLDTEFGTLGTTRHALRGSSTSARVAIQADGKIVVVAKDARGVVVARCTSFGAWDSSFGYGGSVATGIDATGIGSVAVQGDGKILVGGSVQAGSFVARYRSAGSLDPRFGEDGVVYSELQSNVDSRGTLIVQPDGNIVLGGISWNGGDEDFALQRFGSDGRLDTSFGVRGMLVTDLGASSDVIRSLAVQSDGKIVAAGSYVGPLGRDFVVVRYGNGPCGDADRDGNVDATDALLALVASIDSNECELCRCDVDGSGEVTAADALRTLDFGVSGSAALSCTACAGVPADVR